MQLTEVLLIWGAGRAGHQLICSSLKYNYFVEQKKDFWFIFTLLEFGLELVRISYAKWANVARSIILNMPRLAIYYLYGLFKKDNADIHWHKSKYLRALEFSV